MALSLWGFESPSSHQDYWSTEASEFTLGGFELFGLRHDSSPWLLGGVNKAHQLGWGVDSHVVAEVSGGRRLSPTSFYVT